MELLLLREPSGPRATLGRLLVDGEYECDTLEDRVRADPDPRTPANEAKVWGETAIPPCAAGESRIYRVVITYSGRFRRDLPLLEEVPGFSGVRIHAGNTHADTQGCILAGKRMGPGTVVESRRAFAQLYAKIDEAIERGERVHIEIRNPA